jgi:5-formyltetrahydrofolate cyclo-ligase
MWQCPRSALRTRACASPWTSPLHARETTKSLISPHLRPILQPRNMSTEAQEAKKTLRKSIKHRLSQLSQESVLKESIIAQDSVLALPQYQNARRLSIYLSMPHGEARTDKILRDALEKGKQVFVPYIYRTQPTQESGKGKVMDMLRLSSLEEFEGLKRDAWGIPSLDAGSVADRENALGGKGLSQGESHGSGNEDAADEGGLDLIVVPGVAFDAQGNRMGHGAGFYDGYLQRYCAGGKRRKPYLVGLCLAQQMLPAGQITMQDWDWKVDAVATVDKVHIV